MGKRKSEKTIKIKNNAFLGKLQMMVRLTIFFRDVTLIGLWRKFSIEILFNISFIPCDFGISVKNQTIRRL